MNTLQLASNLGKYSKIGAFGFIPFAILEFGWGTCHYDET
jgi:hypothetical protein